jgi:DDE family transposase
VFKDWESAKLKILSGDSCMTGNVSGLEGIGWNWQSKKGKKATKLSGIIELTTGIIINIQCDKATISDLELFDRHMENIPININDSSIFLDKGYISDERKQYFKEMKNINLITPNMSNMEYVNTKKENKLLYEERYKVESHGMKRLKKYNGINLRREKKLNNFVEIVKLMMLYDIFIRCIRLDMVNERPNIPM